MQTPAQSNERMENNPASVVILLPEETLLTFGTELIAFCSNGLNSESEFRGSCMHLLQFD